MNENQNQPFSEQPMPIEQAPASLMPALLALLGLDGSAPTSPTDPSVSALRKALADPDWATRAAAVEQLEDLGDWVSFDLLLSALHDEDEMVRAVAVRVLGKRGDPADRSIRAHLEEALHDPAWHVRETAIYALSELGASASILALSEALRDDDDDVRRAAMHAIDQLHHDAATEPTLNESLESDQDMLSEPAEVPQLFHPEEKSVWTRRAMSRFRPRGSSTSERELAMLEEQDEKQAVQAEQETFENKEPIEAEAISATGKNISIHPVRPRRRWSRTLEQAVAAVLVLGIICGWIILTHLPRATSFSDAGVPSLGAPTVTYQGNATYVYGWSPDNRTLSILQVNTQQNTLDVRMTNVATGKVTVYSVLDGSWIAPLEKYDDFQILQGRYLVVERPLNKSQATLEIWDIIGQRPVTIQTVPGYAPATQLLAPYFFPSENQQKFALYTPDGKVSIWDVVTGQHIACDGSISWLWPGHLQGQWYDHDQFIMFSNRDVNFPGAHGNSSDPAQLSIWNATTGKQIINLSDPDKAYGMPNVSPDGRMLALPVGTWQTTSEPNGGSSGHVHVDTLEILNARSGQVLHTYPLHTPNNIGADFVWQPDSRHLLATYTTSVTTYTSNGTSLDGSMKFYNWDTLTGQQTLITSEARMGRFLPTSDGRYLLVYRSDNSTVDIWQTSNESKVATFVTPNEPTSPYVFTYNNNQELLIVQKNTADIWDIATGKLIYQYHGPTPFSSYGAGGSIIFWSPDNKYLVMLAWKQTSSIGDASLAIWRNP